MAIPPPSFSGFSAAVLAGGQSLRMGTDKAFLRMDGQVLIERQLCVLRECGASEILISGRVGADYSGLGCPIVYDQHVGSGPLAGLAASMRTASFPRLLSLAVDMPQMTSRMLKEIMAHSTETIGCVPVDRSGFQPLAAIYPASLLPLIERRLAQGQNSMRTLIIEAKTLGLIEALQVQPQDEACFINWNQPSDWPLDRERSFSKHSLPED